MDALSDARDRVLLFIELDRVFTVTITSFVSDVDVDVLAGVDVSVVAAVVTALELTMPASLEE